MQRGLPRVIEFACGLADLTGAPSPERSRPRVDSYSIRQPVGVVAGITRSTSPLMVPMWMYPIAIACGNTFVLKPSERDPSVTNFCAELLAKAGAPEACSTSSTATRRVDTAARAPDVGAVSFVGSTPIARHLRDRHAPRQARPGPRRRQNHMVVLPDADMDLAADAAVGAAYGSAGERCMAISVLLTVGDAADKILPKIREAHRGPQGGRRARPLVADGPAHHAAAPRQGARLRRRGREGGRGNPDDGSLKVPGRENGFFLGPTLFDRVSPAMSIYREEIFGPVLSTVRAKTRRGHRPHPRAPYANGVAVFTNDGGAARKFQSEVQVGMVGVNVPIPSDGLLPSAGGSSPSSATCTSTAATGCISTPATRS